MKMLVTFLTCPQLHPQAGFTGNVIQALKHCFALVRNANIPSINDENAHFNECVDTLFDPRSFIDRELIDDLA